MDDVLGEGTVAHDALHHPEQAPALLGVEALHGGLLAGSAGRQGGFVIEFGRDGRHR